MREFVFYTEEGYCEAPSGHVAENFQVLGFEQGANSTEA